MTEYASGVPLQIRSWDDERTFEARVCNYGVVDSKGTSWKAGCFTRSLEGGLPKSVWAHDWSKPIGRVTSYRDSADGLDVTVQLADFDAVPDARMAHSLLKDGVVDQFSFGFYRIADEPDPDHRGAKMVTEADIKEVSPVLVGSVPGTRTIAVRSHSTPLEDMPLAAQRASMKRTPHKPDAELCTFCGGSADATAHQRAETTIEVRDLAISMAADPTDDTDTDGLILATDAAVDAAIALASYQDMTTLPPWVAQMLALVMAADAAIDAAIDQMGLPDPDEDGNNNMMARAIQPVETRDETAEAQMRASLDKLAVLSARSYVPFGSR